MSVRQCQREVSSAEFVEWMAFFQIDGLTSEMDDLRFGLVTAATYNVHRDVKKARKPFGPVDVVPWLNRAEPAADAGPVLLADKTAQSNLICAALFGKAANG